MIHTTNLDLFAGIPVADYAAPHSWSAALHGNQLPTKAAYRTMSEMCTLPLTRWGRNTRIVQ